MEKIVLHQIYKKENVISYDFSVSKGLSEFFSGKKFEIEYSEDIESVPDSIASIPFVCNILPIIWLTNSKLILKCLDRNFYDCLPNVKKGYEIMFPESEFKGELEVSKIELNESSPTSRCAMFYSGGVDSMQTLVSHLDENPDLISIWGSDIQYNNREAWDLVHKAIEEASQKCDLKDIVIHSSFRKFDNEGVLHKRFSRQLKDGWWHGVKHGIALLGHVAPYAYLHDITTMYIASSHCPADGKVRCASNPLIDNSVRFGNCKVVHDGFEYSRQDKIHNIVEFNRKNNLNLPLHVCWESQSGGNCCRCEKCYRTIVGILAEEEDPSKYGFDNWEENIKYMRQNLVLKKSMYEETFRSYWTHIQKRLFENRHFLKGKSYWKYIRWILDADFTHPEKLKMPLLYRMRSIFSNFLFYQKLHELKVNRQ
ncbi:MAG: hypothetical protein SOU03_09445 [Dorea sp.]|nr:hypothetical protein [Dorea sp.]